MRFMIWNGDMGRYECSECSWKQLLCADCTDPAEKLELQFNQHECEGVLRGMRPETETIRRPIEKSA